MVTRARYLGLKYLNRVVTSTGFITLRALSKIISSDQ